MAYTTIKKPSDYFNTVTYTGTAGGQTISGVGHQPDFIWVKQRGDAGYDHSLHNSVSGLLKQLISNSTAAEITNTDTITSNNSDGFVLGADTAGPNANSNNQDTKNYVAWNWKANGSGSANTDGSISSTVSANTTSGFSIVSYTGTGANATVGHGLGSTPSVVMVKRRNGNSWWYVRHTGTNITDGHVFLNTTSPASTQSTSIIGLSSSTFSIGTEVSVNDSGGTYIAYCFAEKQGFSKFGSYVANGSNDGPMIYLGFKPAFVLIKRTSNTNVWILLDNKRGSYNVNQSKLYPDNNDAENTDTSNGIDFLSNGFKIRRNNTEINGAAGDTFIYMAFAEEPLVGDNPATAR